MPPLTSTIAVKSLNGKVKVLALSVPLIQELGSGFSYDSACCDDPLKPSELTQTTGL